MHQQFIYRLARCSRQLCTAFPALDLYRAYEMRHRFEVDRLPRQCQYKFSPIYGCDHRLLGRDADGRYCALAGEIWLDSAWVKF